MRATAKTFSVAVISAVIAIGSTAALASETCSDLFMVWHDPASDAVIRSEPYVCGSDLCAGYRCKEGNEISPACYSADQCPAACAGECVYVPSAQLDCPAMCGSTGCGIVMTWYKRRTLVRSEPYDCTADACAGLRCLDGNEISPACYDAAQCAKSCKSGTCVDIEVMQQGDCNAALCGGS